MGVIDEFLRAHVTPGLLPGEQILGFMHARVPYRFNGLGVPSAYFQWLGAATSTRLVLFRTELDFLGDPQAQALDTQVWSYDEIARVALGDVEGLTSATFFTLVPHPMLGPAQGNPGRYDLYPTCKGLDDHARTRAQFPGWLAQQVAAGAFPLSAQKRAEIEAKVAAGRAAEQEKIRRQNEAFQRALPHVGRAAVALGPAGIGLFASLVLYKAILHYQEHSAPYQDPAVTAAEHDLAHIKRGRRPDHYVCSSDDGAKCESCSDSRYDKRPGYQTVKDINGESWRCPPTRYYEGRINEVRSARRAKEKEAIEEREGKATTELILAGVSGLGLLGSIAALVGLAIWDAKRRARAAASAPLV